MSKKKTIIVLFRLDLRLRDHPALYHACKDGETIFPVFILDDARAGKWKIGHGSRWWLHHSLLSLKKQLKEKGSDLFLYRGNTVDILSNLMKKHQIQALYFNQCYEPYSIALEKELQNLFPTCKSFNGSLLFEPEELLNRENKPFKMFTPFWNTCLKTGHVDIPLPIPKINTTAIESESLDSLNLLPSHAYSWEVGEPAALKKFHSFLNTHFRTYEEHRDYPYLDGTSSLSPHLHFGEISVREIYHAVLHNHKFLSELGWREFSYYQLYHFPQLTEKPIKSEFQHFSWKKNEQFLEKWQQGNTGYPIVDAAMRQLKATGWIHNRLRMIVASFLIKHLLQPWQLGEEWFWETLVDGDLAINATNWQWVAGCGVDSAPFFRIFNPTLQEKKFDPEGTYIKKWIPELTHYPKPIVDHNQARIQALEAFQKIKKRGLD